MDTGQDLIVIGLDGEARTIGEESNRVAKDRERPVIIPPRRSLKKSDVPQSQRRVKPLKERKRILAKKLSKRK